MRDFFDVVIIPLPIAMIDQLVRFEEPLAAILPAQATPVPSRARTRGMTPAMVLPPAADA